MNFASVGSRAVSVGNIAAAVGKLRGLRLLCLVALWQSFAPAVWADSTDDIVLTARPGLCVLKDVATKECVMGVRLEWHGPQGDYCLFEGGVQAPLSCWVQEQEGQHDAALVSADDVVYSLLRTASDRPAAQISVRVLSLAQRRPSRHRRRHAWAPL